MKRRKRGESNKKYTQDEFVRMANDIHGGYYDYSKVEYVNVRTPVCIICPKHGEFWQEPDSHLSGKGCHKCGREQTTKKQSFTTEEIINRFKEKYGDIDDYSKVEYVNANTPVCIITPEYGEIWKRANEYLKNRKPRAYLSEDEVIEIAKGYETKKDFCANEKSAAYFAKKYELYFDWFKPSNREKKENKMFCIYTYEDIDTKSVYVGLTYHLKDRHKDHLRDKKDTARLYFENIGKPLPTPRVKMTDLDAENAQYYEHWYREAYAKEGWNVLNIAKTGIGSSSVGGDPIWTKEKCIEAIAKCKTRTDFLKQYPGAYAAMKRYGWDNEIDLPDKIGHPSRWRPVIQYDIDMNFIRRYDAIKDVPYGGKRHSNISACCRGRKDSAYGYKWRYAS